MENQEKQAIIILPKLYNANGDVTKKWFVFFSVKNPLNGKFVRYRIYKGVNESDNQKQRTVLANNVIVELNERLKNGWTPENDGKIVYNDQLVYAAVARNYGRKKQSNRTIAFLASEFLEHKEGKLAKKSKQSYVSKMRILVAWIENNGYASYDISKITTPIIKLFFDWIIKERNLDRITVKKYRQTIFSLFRYIEIKYNIINPVRDIELPVKKVDNAARPILKNDLIKILDYAEYNDPQLYLGLLIQYYSAIRPGNELRNLKIKDIDFYNNQAVVNAVSAKTERRIVVLPTAIVNIMIEKFLLNRFNPEYYVFGRNRVPGFEMVGQNTLRNRFNQIRERLNLPDHYKFYSLKHTGAGKLLESGKTIVEIKEWCGHKSIEHTEHYVRRHFGNRNERIINSFPDPRA